MNFDCVVKDFLMYLIKIKMACIIMNRNLYSFELINYFIPITKVMSYDYAITIMCIMFM